MHPILFQIGPFTVYSYGFMVALGTLIATFLAARHGARNGIDFDDIVDLIFWVVVWGLIGGRLLYVFLNMTDYRDNFFEILKIYKGGLVFHGSLIFGLISALVFIKQHQLSFFKVMDLVILYVPLAHAFGRIGCFLNGCCFGRPAGFGWGVIFPHHFIRVHPTQIYSALLLLAIFIILLVIDRKKKFNGEIFCAYLILYGLMRFFIEFLRGDNPVVISFLSLFQFISIFLFFLGVGLYIYLARKSKKRKNIE
ncbi:MAG: prolipoprotein diacylglyceryl transferase [Candidatus Omnitrophota bacterium]